MTNIFRARVNVIVRVSVSVRVGVEVKTIVSVMVNVVCLCWQLGFDIWSGLKLWLVLWW